MNIDLAIGTTSSEVIVISDAPLVETGRSVTSTAISEQQVENLPINGRNFLDFTLLTPGVVRDPTRSGDLSFGGQRGTLNSLLVDGADPTTRSSANPQAVPVQAVIRIRSVRMRSRNYR